MHYAMMRRTPSGAASLARGGSPVPSTPFELICALLRARLRGAQPPPHLGLHFGGDPDVDLVWARIASMHRLTPALAGCIRDLGVTGALPAELRAYLDAIAAGNASRNQQVRDQLHQIVLRLNSLGIVPCLLKGAARLVDRLYPDDSWRFMIDIDLLLPSWRMSAALAALQQAGYVVCDPIGDGKPHHHEPPLVHRERGVSVELHRYFGGGLQRRLLPVDEIRARIQLRDTPLGRVGLLAPEDQIVYLVGHLQVEDGCWFQGTTRLRDLIELDLLVGRYGGALDWAEIVGTLSGAGCRRACLSTFCTASRLLGTPLPEIVTAEFDPGIRRGTARVIRQERSSTLMRIGLAYGWAARHLQRLAMDAEHRRHVTRGWHPSRVRNSLRTLRCRLSSAPY